MSTTRTVVKFSEDLYEGYHYAQAIRVGDTVWIGGLVGVTDELTPGDGIEDQARLMFEMAERVLSEAGATLADIVEMTTYHLTVQGEDFETFEKVHHEFFPSNYPVWTGVAIEHLALPELLVEMRATAVVGSAAR